MIRARHRGLGQAKAKEIDWVGLYRKGRQVNLLSAARFFLFGSRDVWFEIGLPLFLKTGLGWNKAFVGLFLAGTMMLYSGALQEARSTNETGQRFTALPSFTLEILVLLF